MFDQRAADHAVRAISRKWTLHVLAQLQCHEGSGYKELERATDLEHKVLDRELRNLEVHGLVVRELYTQRPLRVRYRLTQRAHELLKHIELLAHWWNSDI